MSPPDLPVTIVKLSPEDEAVARAHYRDGTAVPAEAYMLGTHDALDALEKGLAVFKPTVDALLDAVKRGDIVAKVAAGPNGIAIAFATADDARQEVVFAKAGKPLPLRHQERTVRPVTRPPSTSFVLPGARNGRGTVAPRGEPSITRGQELEGIREAENDLQNRLVALLEEECASESSFSLDSRLFGRIVDVVSPATPDNQALADQKASWFVKKCMAVFDRRDPKKMSRADLVALVADIASSGRRGQA